MNYTHCCPDHDKAVVKQTTIDVNTNRSECFGAHFLSMVENNKQLGLTSVSGNCKVVCMFFLTSLQPEM